MPKPSLKSSSSSQAADPSRCQFAYADGRRCQMLRSATHAFFCVFHARQEREASLIGSDVSRELASLSGTLETASDVNRVLKQLFLLFSQGRITRRDAVAYGYIAQLILQTLPGVKREIQLAFGPDIWRQCIASAHTASPSTMVTPWLASCTMTGFRSTSLTAPSSRTPSAEIWLTRRQNAAVSRPGC